MRLTRTDACGAPIAEATANSRITTAGFISLTLSADVFEGSDIEIANAAGVLCVEDKGTDSLKGLELELKLCDVNESILEMLLGAAILTDYSMPVEQVGFVLPSTDVSLGLNYAMLEIWSRNANNEACVTADNPARPYFQWLLPKTSRWQLGGSIDFADGHQEITLTGYAESNSAFAASRADDEWTAADIAAIIAGGPLAGREVTALPEQVSGSGYDT